MTHLFRRKLTLVAVPLVAVLSLSACGGGGESGSGRPSTDQLVTAMTSGKAASMMGLQGASLNSSMIQCIAQKIEDSKISDDALRAIVNGDENFKESSADDAALQDIGSQLTACAKG